MEVFPLTLGQRLRLIRQRRGLTQKAVAALLGIRPPSLCAYEKDQSEPNVATLNWYCRYFDVSADWLLGVDNTEDKKEEIEENEQDNAEEDALESEGSDLIDSIFRVESTSPPYTTSSDADSLSAEDVHRLRKLLEELN